MRFTFLSRIILLFALIWNMQFGIVYAQNSDVSQLFNPPKKATSVYDYANLLSESENQYLTQKLIAYFDSTSTQIVVLTIETIGDYEIKQLGTEIAHKWGIGGKEKDNGVLLLVAKTERQVAILTGYGVEDKLTDYNSKLIIDQYISPAFKKGNYFLGLDEGTNSIIALLEGSFIQDKKKEEKIPSIFVLLFIVIIIFIIFFIGRKGGGGKGGGSSSRFFDIFLLMTLLGNSGSSISSGRGGGFGSGGFGGGFGGGGFGGGGASGGW